MGKGGRGRGGGGWWRETAWRYLDVTALWNEERERERERESE